MADPTTIDINADHLHLVLTAILAGGLGGCLIITFTTILLAQLTRILFRNKKYENLLWILGSILCILWFVLGVVLILQTPCHELLAASRLDATENSLRWIPQALRDWDARLDEFLRGWRKHVVSIGVQILVGWVYDLVLPRKRSRGGEGEPAEKELLLDVGGERVGFSSVY